jgi:hypothetical protein
MTILWFTFCPNSTSSGIASDSETGGIDLSAGVFVLVALEAIKNKYKEELEGIGLTKLTLCGNDGTSFDTKSIISVELLEGSLERPLKLKFSPAQQGKKLHPFCINRIHLVFVVIIL